MAKSQTTLPHKSSELFLTDGGLETTLLFLDGFELPGFAAFDLLKDEKGYKGIADYYTRYLRIAKNFKTNFILESATWRANPDWIEKLGYPGSAILEINKKAVEIGEIPEKKTGNVNLGRVKIIRRKNDYSLLTSA